MLNLIKIRIYNTFSKYPQPQYKSLKENSYKHFTISFFCFLIKTWIIIHCKM